MVLIPNKRVMLAKGLSVSGMIRVIERLARRPGLLVLTYHRIGNPANCEDYGPVYSASSEGLESTLRALKNSHDIMNLAEVCSLSENGFRLDRPAALVTFDDGYRDNFEQALPVLKALKVPATFFIPTRFFEGPFVPWWDRIAWTVRHATVSILRVKEPVPVEVDLTSTPIADAVFRFVRAFRDHRVDDEPAYFQELEERAGVFADVALLSKNRFMSWEQLRELVAAGQNIGSHAHSHRRLLWLTEDQQREEFARSKRILEETLGIEIRGLAYPYGWPGAYDATTERLASETGYHVAFSSVPGLNRPGATNPFAVQRLGVGFADTPALLRTRWTLLEALGKSVV